MRVMLANKTKRRDAPPACGVAPRLVRFDCFAYFCEIGLLVFSCAAFSSARAPAMMLTTSLLLSLHAYSNIGPLIAAKGTMAVHGFVHVDGSSTVKVYSMRSAATRLKRSVIFKVFGLAPR